MKGKIRNGGIGQLLCRWLRRHNWSRWASEGDLRWTVFFRDEDYRLCWGCSLVQFGVWPAGIPRNLQLQGRKAIPTDNG